MRFGVIALVAGLAALPAVAGAQTYSAVAPGSTSIIRQTGYGWRNHVVVPDGPCGCAMPVKADCYNQCCSHCGIRPLCLLSKFGRMLDCLLPCNRCCGGGMAHGCLLGGRGCGSCSMSCGGCDSCSGPVGCGCSSGAPGLTDPFQDDPAPPKPAPGTDVRRLSPKAHSAAVARNHSHAAVPQKQAAWKVNTPAAMTRSPVVKPSAVQASRPRVSPFVIAKPDHRQVEQSILRRTSLDEAAVEPAQLNIDAAGGATPIIRSQSPAEDDVPQNPLR